MKTLEEQFDKKFCNERGELIETWDSREDMEVAKQIKQFYSSKISKLLKDLVGEEIMLSVSSSESIPEDKTEAFSLGEDSGSNIKRQEDIDIIKASEFKELIYKYMSKQIRQKRIDTKIGTIEKKYGVDLGARSDMKLGNYLKKEGLPSMSKALKNVEKKSSKR